MEYLAFTETAKFERNARDLIGEDEIAKLQIHLCKYPKVGVVIPASNGIRKLRWSSSGRGSRGGARVIYYIAISLDRIILLDIYAKNEKSDLSRAELNLLELTVNQWLKRISN
jgi:mRNA-degrading endonuclease RelE of RelBE toxin-antitoxin system